MTTLFFVSGLVLLVGLDRLVALVLLDYFTSAPLALYVSPLRMMRSCPLMRRFCVSTLSVVMSSTALEVGL